MFSKKLAVPEAKLSPAEVGQNARTGTRPRGYGAMRDVPLNIDPRIDLTQPIYEQVLALEKADKEAAGTK